MPSEEQKRIGEHPADAHGRILAGPGTGKSTTVLSLAARVRGENKAIRVITFTRAATAELVAKIKDEKHEVVEPTTVHAFALSVLMRNPGRTPLPEPLRVPDEWETATLIHKDLAARLRRDRFQKTLPAHVRKLETEMASEWESLDPNERLLADLDPALRNRYLALWSAHRRLYGYSLFAEMPLYAKNLIEDAADVNIGALDLLVVDEFQDLNRCEIALMEALAKRGIRVVAVGDDDQSIYSMRMAHPIGIQEFPQRFDGTHDYSLSVSFRCGKAILDVAKALIESAPNRPARTAVRPSDDNPPGTFRYLRFYDQDDERRGVGALVAHFVKRGVKPSKIVVMLRADFNSTWSNPLRAAIEAHGIAVTDVEAALEPLSTKSARNLLAIARLAESRQDDLAWWTLLWGTNGISDEFLTTLADYCMAKDERFSAIVTKLDDLDLPNVSKQ